MTPEEIVDSICRWKNTGLRQSVIDAITDAIAAEREACAKATEDLRDYTPEEYDRESHKWLTRAAAAIRARGKSS